MDHAPHEPVCLVTYTVGDVVTLAEIPESCVDIATRLGWAVLIRDSDMPPQDIEPSQRNPNRIGED